MNDLDALFTALREFRSLNSNTSDGMHFLKSDALFILWYLMEWAHFAVMREIFIRQWLEIPLNRKEFSPKIRYTDTVIAILNSLSYIGR